MHCTTLPYPSLETDEKIISKSLHQKSKNFKTMTGNAKQVTVYPESRKPEASSTAIGVWAYPPGVPPLDDVEWELTEILVYPDGEKPDGFGKSGPHGIWGYPPDAVPTAGSAFDPKYIRVYPSGAMPPPGHVWADNDPWKPFGVWTLVPVAEKAKTDETTANTKAPESTSSAASKLDEPQVVTVFPENEKPDGLLDKVGVWAYPPGVPRIDDADWEPKEVIVYPPGQKPDDFGKDKEVPHGLWAYIPGTKPKEFDPKDIRIFPSGAIPPEGHEWADDDPWKPEGVWTMTPEPTVDDAANKAGGGSTADSEKPSGPLKVNVYPESKKAEAAKEDTKAIWGYPPGVPVIDDDDWDPMEVNLFQPGEKPDNFGEEGAGYFGMWGYVPGAKPKDDGTFDPKDIWVSPAGAIPPEGHEWADDDPWKPEGVWAMDPDPEDEANNANDDGQSAGTGTGTGTGATKSTAPIIEKPTEVTVYPAANKPLASTKPVAAWKHPKDDKPDDSDNWEPMKIVAYPKDEKPDTNNDLLHGTWGTGPDNDIQVLPPGVEPDADDDTFTPQGKWTTLPGKLDAKWPPEPKQRRSSLVKVGKLDKKLLGKWSFDSSKKK